MAAANVWFKRQQRPVEFIVVAESESRVVPLSGSPATSHAKTLQAAIEKCSFEQVAILDPVYRFDSIHWNLVDPKGKSEAFRSWSFAATRAPGSRKLLANTLVVITRLLLGVRKTRLACGLVTFTKTQLSQIDLSRLDHDSPDAPVELLALAKSKGMTIEEIQSGSRQAETHWTKADSCEPNLPRSGSLKRSIKTAFRFWFSEIAFPAQPSVASITERQRTTAPTRAMLTGGLMVLAAMLLFVNIGYPLFEPDETRNAQLALNVLESGDWISLSLSGEPYYDKPPLLAWLTAISYSLFGISEWATRFPAALASFLTVGFMIHAGRKLFGFRMAILGSATLLLAGGFASHSRYVTMDSLLTLFTTMTTLGIAVAIESRTRKRERRWLRIAGIAMGLGLLSKGPICAVLTLPPIALWLMLNRDVSSRNVRSTIKSVLISACLVAAPWYLLNSIKDPRFLWQFFWKHHVVRFSDAFIHVEPFWYYLPICFLMMFPASILLPRTVHAMTSGKRKHRDLRSSNHGLLLLVSLWTVGFFSMSQCKLPSYILPALPMLALLTGASLDAELKRSIGQRTRIDRLSKRVAIGTCCLSGLAVAIGCRFDGQSLAMVSLAVLVVVASIGLASFFPVKRSTKRQTSWKATFVVAFLFVFLCVNFVVPSIASQRSILNAISMDDNNSSIPVVYFGRDSFASSIFLPDREVTYFDEESLAAAKTWLQAQSQAFCVASDANADRIRESLGDRGSVEKTPMRHTFKISLRPSRVADSDAASTTRK